MLSPSSASDDSLIALGIADERIGRWDRGVDLAPLLPAQARSRGCCPASSNVLYAGRLTKEKGADLLADAFLEANAARPAPAPRARRRRPGGAAPLRERLGERRDVPRLARGRGARARLRERRHVPVRQPHRHLRPGHPRGAGQRACRWSRSTRAARSSLIEDGLTGLLLPARPELARLGGRAARILAGRSAGGSPTPPSTRWRCAAGTARWASSPTATGEHWRRRRRRRLRSARRRSANAHGRNNGRPEAEHPDLRPAVSGQDASAQAGPHCCRRRWRQAAASASAVAGATSRRARARLTSTASAPAPPARAKAAAGPAPSATAPATAAPREEPTATAVDSQANASVTVPAGAAPLDHCEDGGVGGRDRGAGEQQDGGHRAARAAGGGRQGRVTRGEGHEHQREAGGRADAAAERARPAAPPISEPTPQRPSSGPAATVLPSAVAAAVIATSDRAEDHAHGEHHDHERADGGCAQRAAARPARHGGGPPAREAGCGREGGRGADQQRGRPRSAPRRWTTEPPRPSASGGPRSRSARSRWRSTANAARVVSGSRSSSGRIARTQADAAGVAKPMPAARATSSGSGAPAGSSAIATSSARGGDARRPAARRSGRGGPTTRAEHRRAGAERDRVGGGHEPGGGERAGQAPGVDQQSDAEHRQRQAGQHDIAIRRSAPGVWAIVFTVGHGTVPLVQIPDPLLGLWTRPVSRSSC